MTLGQNKENVFEKARSVGRLSPIAATHPELIFQKENEL
jgi:hypothetical protein